MTEKPSKIELTLEEIEALRERIRTESLVRPDYRLLDAIIINYFALEHVYQEQVHTLRRMAKQVFGPRTEKAKGVLKSPSPELPSPTAKPQSNPFTEKTSGHGRNGVSAYAGAEKVWVPHPCYKAGDPCPYCLKGKLYPFGEPGVEVRIAGRSPCPFGKPA